MLQRLIAALLGLLGLAAAALGIASATAWRADDPLIATATADTPILVTEPGVLEVAGEPVTVTVRASGSPVVLAVGRDTDVAGWVGDDPHQLVTGLADWHDLALQNADAAPNPSATADPSGSPAAAEASEPAAQPSPSASADGADPQTTAAADPTGSDMWVTEVTGDGSATLEWTAPPDGRWSLLAVSLGDTAPTLDLSWPQDVTTPWLWPGVAAGVLLLAIAAILAIRIRRSRTGADWHDVSTGMIAVVTPQTADGAPLAVTGPPTTGTIPLIDPTTGLPLTRRQIREAEAAAAAARRGRRGATGAVPLVTGAIPTVPAPVAPSETADGSHTPETPASTTGSPSDPALPSAATPSSRTPDSSTAGEPTTATPSPQTPVPSTAGEPITTTPPRVGPTSAAASGAATPQDAPVASAGTAAAPDSHQGTEDKPRRTLFGRRRANRAEQTADVPVVSDRDRPASGSAPQEPSSPTTGATAWTPTPPTAAPSTAPTAAPSSATTDRPATDGRHPAPPSTNPATTGTTPTPDTAGPASPAAASPAPAAHQPSGAQHHPAAGAGVTTTPDVSPPAASGNAPTEGSPSPTDGPTEGRTDAESGRRGFADRLPWRRQREQQAAAPAGSTGPTGTERDPDAPHPSDDDVPAVPGVDEEDDSMSTTQRADSWRRMWGFPADAEPDGSGAAQPEADTTDREEDR